MTARPHSEHGHLSKEAFMLMRYRCRECRNVEVVWNSRDGVTPFIVGCAKCDAGDAQHIDWDRDRYSPFHVPPVGARVFIDLTPEQALADAGPARQRMMEHAEQFGEPPTVEQIALQDLLSFAPHTPHLMVVNELWQAFFEKRAEVWRHVGVVLSYKRSEP